MMMMLKMNTNYFLFPGCVSSRSLLQISTRDVSKEHFKRIVIKKRITGLANVSLLCSILYIFLKALEQNMEPTKRKAFDPM